jgi:hypothetical protein
MFGMGIGDALSILAIGILVVGAARLLIKGSFGDLLRSEHRSAPRSLFVRRGHPWTMLDWVVVSLSVLLPLASFAYLTLGWLPWSRHK